MPDSYWEEFGKTIKRKPYSCPSCGRGVDSVVEIGHKCDVCRRVPIPPQRAKCVTCGEDFMPTALRTKRCPDCVGERSETREPSIGGKIRDGNRMKMDDDP